MIRVHVITPSRADVRVEHAQFREYLASRERRFELVLGYSDAQPISANRNRIARKFLADERSNYLLMVDSDQAPAFNPLDYVARDLDVLGFPCPTWRANNKDPLLWFPEPPSDEGIKTQLAVTTGCILIARRVLAHSDMQHPFADEWDSHGLKKEGEDITFCQRATAAGFGVWCAMDKPVTHIKAIELITLWQYVHKTGRFAEN